MSQSEFVWCPLIFTAETIVANIYEAIPILLALGLPSGSDGKESACNVGDPDLIPGLGISPGEGNGYPLQYSSLKNFQGWRSLAGYGLWVCKELDMIE